MTANRIVNGLALIWGAMMLGSVLHPVLATVFAGDTRDARVDDLDRIALFLIWQINALLPAVAALGVRIAVAERISGPARWAGWVPATGSGIGLAVLVSLPYLLGD